MKSNSLGSRTPSILNHADRIGSLLSTLCAVHCMCMPVLISLLPVIGLSFLTGHKFERVACVTMVLLAAACVWSGCRFHRRWGLLVLLCAGAAVVLYAQFAGPPQEKETQADWHEAIAMAIGGSLIAASHLLNLKLRARCHCARCEETGKG